MALSRPYTAPIPRHRSLEALKVTARRPWSTWTEGSGERFRHSGSMDRPDQIQTVPLGKQNVFFWQDTGRREILSSDTELSTSEINPVVRTHREDAPVLEALRYRDNVRAYRKTVRGQVERLIVCSDDHRLVLRGCPERIRYLMEKLFYNLEIDLHRNNWLKGGAFNLESDVQDINSGIERILKGGSNENRDLGAFLAATVASPSQGDEASASGPARTSMLYESFTWEGRAQETHSNGSRYARIPERLSSSLDSPGDRSLSIQRSGRRSSEDNQSSRLDIWFKQCEDMGGEQNRVEGQSKPVISGDFNDEGLSNAGLWQWNAPNPGRLHEIEVRQLVTEALRLHSNGLSKEDIITQILFPDMPQLDDQGSRQRAPTDGDSMVDK